MFNIIKYFTCFIKTKRAIALFVLYFSFCTAQTNLIVNASFENSISTPTTFAQFSLCANWYAAFGSPEYFSVFSPTTSVLNQTCSVAIPKSDIGIQSAHDGNFYAGLGVVDYYSVGAGYPKFTVFSELIGSQLNSSLLKNHVYDFSLFYSLAESSSYINNNLSAYFSTSQFSLATQNWNPLSQQWYDTNFNSKKTQVNHDTTQYLNYDTTSWTKLNGCFIAAGGENFVTIGNFKDNTFQKYKNLNSNFVSTCGAVQIKFAYLFIDDLSLYDLGYYSGAAKAKKDTTLCFNTSYVIGNNVKDSAAVTWWPNVALSCTNCPNPIANPTITTKYYVQKTIGCISSKDSILITVFTPSLNANAGTKQLICVNDQVQLGINDANSFTTYTWQPINHLSCFNCAQPIAQPFSTITYTLNKQECAITTTSTVEVLVDNCKLQLPQAFSPNGDGINEQLIITIPFAQSAQLTVFNRWGSELYSTSNNKQGSQASTSLSLTWDGKAHKGLLLPHGETGEGLLPSGTYYYLVEVTQLDGTKKVYKEFVVLVR